MSEIPHELMLVGVIIFAAIMSVGVGLSAWKGEFGANGYYCTNCSNPKHWSPEAQEKFAKENEIDNSS